MPDGYVLIDCRNGHHYMSGKLATGIKGPVSQQLAYPTRGQRWEVILLYAIDLTGRGI